MGRLTIETWIDAPAEVCFDLARDERVHTETTVSHNGEFGPGQSVTFEGIHFGMRQRMTVKVTEYDRPRLFVDEMTQGAFNSFRHKHEFKDKDVATLMRDTVEWVSPMGPLGRLIDEVLVEPHMAGLITRRNIRLKALAEEANGRD